MRQRFFDNSTVQAKIDQHLLKAFDLVLVLDPDQAAEAFLEGRGKQRQASRACAQYRLQQHMGSVQEQAPALSWAAEHLMQKFFTAARQVAFMSMVLQAGLDEALEADCSNKRHYHDECSANIHGGSKVQHEDQISASELNHGIDSRRGQPISHE